MLLYVVRHAIAEPWAPGGDDWHRRLTKNGRGKMRAAARGLARLDVAVDVLLTSPLPRAAETAAIVSEEVAGVPAPRECQALATGVSAGELLRELRPWGDAESLMLVGHEPMLSELVSVLLTGSPAGAGVDMKKGACALLELEGLAPHGAALLRWLLPPRALRRLGERGQRAQGGHGGQGGQ